MTDPAARHRLQAGRALLAAVWVTLASVLPLFLTGAMAVQIGRSMSVAPTTLALLATGFALANVAASAALGRRVGVWGVRVSLRISAMGTAAALAAAALSPTVLWLALASVLGGVANALAQPAGNALVAAQLSPHRYGLGFAIKQSGIPLATLFGGLAVPVVALTVGWRAAYGAAAVIALVGLAIVPPDRTVTAGRSEGPVPPTLLRPLWVLAIGASGAVLAATSIGALGAAGAVAIGIGEGTAGYLVAAGGLAGLAVRLGAGVAADRFHFDALRGVSVLCVAGACGWILMSLEVPVWFAVGLIVANAFGWGWPGLQHLAIARRFPTATAAASGIQQTGIAIGLLVGPALLATITTSAGWQWTWMTAAISAVVGAVAVTAASRKIPALG